MKKILPLLSSVSFLFSCSPDITITVKRNPLIQFSTNTMTWKADSYYFTDVAQVVAYPYNTTQPGKIYNRYTLQAFGKNDKGQDLQFNIIFDVVDPAKLTGLYRSRYSTDRGLSQVQIFNLDNNNLAAYALSPNDSTAVLNIQRQSQTERLIAGNFQMTIQNIRDTTQKINITNGILTDVRY